MCEHTAIDPSGPRNWSRTVYLFRFLSKVCALPIFHPWSQTTIYFHSHCRTKHTIRTQTRWVVPASVGFLHFRFTQQLQYILWSVWCSWNEYIMYRETRDTYCLVPQRKSRVCHASYVRDMKQIWFLPCYLKYTCHLPGHDRVPEPADPLLQLYPLLHYITLAARRIKKKSILRILYVVVAVPSVVSAITRQRVIFR